QGRFYPTIWFDRINSSVSVNFGQSEFLFNFQSLLPSGYMEQLLIEQQQRSSNQIITNKSAAEIKRRTAAEDLVVLMGGSFPIELCEIALERTGDSMES